MISLLAWSRDPRASVASKPLLIRPALALLGLLLLAACGGEEPVDPASMGEALAQEKGCLNCHSTDGSRSVGPTWKGLAGARETLADGTTVIADDAYLKESIQQPGAKTVRGYPAGSMETVIRPGSVSDRQAAQLIAYIKTLK